MNTLYLTKNKDGRIFVHEFFPEREGDIWVSIGDLYEINEGLLKLMIENDNISWIWNESVITMSCDIVLIA